MLASKCLGIRGLELEGCLVRRRLTCSCDLRPSASRAILGASLDGPAGDFCRSVVSAKLSRGQRVESVHLHKWTTMA